MLHIRVKVHRLISKYSTGNPETLDQLAHYYGFSKRLLNISLIQLKTN